MLNIISHELGIKGNVRDILDKHFEYVSKYKEQSKNEYHLQFEGYRDFDQKDKEKHYDNQPNILKFQNWLSKFC